MALIFVISFFQHQLGPLLPLAELEDSAVVVVLFFAALGSCWPILDELC